MQKDLRTGESRVLSTCTVSAQELQQRGVKVYDDGHKSVYAVPSGPGQPRVSGVDELTTREVEDLLQQASMRKQKNPDEVPCSLNQQRNLRSVMSDWPELEYIDSDQQDVYDLVQDFQSYHLDQDVYHIGNEVHGGATRQSVTPVNPRPSSSLLSDSGPRNLDAMSWDEPITMIFMGYQQAEDEAQSFEGSVQAELIIIDDADEKPATDQQKEHPHPRKETNKPTDSGSRKNNVRRLKSCCMLM